MKWELVVLVCLAFVAIAPGKKPRFVIYPRLDKNRMKIIDENNNTKDVLRKGCWVKLDPNHRRAVVEEEGVCRRVCKKPSKRLLILNVIFCKKKAPLHFKYDFLVEECQLASQHQTCHVQGIYYDPTQNNFPVRLDFDRCKMRQRRSTGLADRICKEVWRKKR